jgi:hypothetical protein
MKTLTSLFFVVFFFSLISCKKKQSEPEPETPTPISATCTPNIIIVNNNIDTVTVWKECNIYVISANQISVNSTLTIEPGVIIKFKDIVGDNAIQVSNSGKIMAMGSADKPIVFTSYKDDAHGGDSNNDGTSSSPSRYDWGGLIINSNSCVFKYCEFFYGGEGPNVGAGQPTLEFSYYYGNIDHCTFANCGGDSTYAGYGVVDARYCENPNFVITNSIFYACIKPLFLSPHNSIDNSNTFHDPANPLQKNKLNGIFLTSTANEATTDVSWLETEVPFVLTGSIALNDGLKLIVAQNVIIKVATLPAIGFNKIAIKDGVSFIQGYNLPGVFFTSYLDDAHGGDTNGDGGATSPGTSDWYGVQDISAVIGTNNNCYNWSNILYATYP